MKVELSIEKKHVYLLMVTLLFCTGVIFAIANDNGNDPAYFGHGVDEIDWSQPIPSTLTVNGDVDAQRIFTQGFRVIQMTNQDQRWDFIVGSSENDRRFGIFDDTANTYAFIIRGDNRNTGIGVGNPSQKLHVGGNVRAEGYCIGSNCITNWNQVGGSGNGGGSPPPPAGCEVLAERSSGGTTNFNVPDECKGNVCTIVVRGHNNEFYSTAIAQIMQSIPGLPNQNAWISTGGAMFITNQPFSPGNPVSFSYQGVNGQGAQHMTPPSYHDEIGSFAWLYDDYSNQNNPNQWILRVNPSGAQGAAYLCR